VFIVGGAGATGEPSSAVELSDIGLAGRESLDKRK
jgi:hypothetical protein